MGLFLAAVLLNQLLVPTLVGLGWVPVLLYLKLLVSHLLPEAPFTDPTAEMRRRDRPTVIAGRAPSS